jgi:hypothetical protein
MSLQGSSDTLSRPEVLGLLMGTRSAYVPTSKTGHSGRYLQTRAGGVATTSLAPPPARLTLLALRSTD